MQRVLYKINPRRNRLRHTLIKLKKIKHEEKILKVAREKQQVTYKENPIRLTADLSAQRSLQEDIFKIMKGKDLQPRLLYPARVSFRFREIKSFTDSQKLREFSITKAALQQMLKEVPHTGNKKRPTKRNPKQ